MAARLQWLILQRNLRARAATHLLMAACLALAGCATEQCPPGTIQSDQICRQAPPKDEALPVQGKPRAPVKSCDDPEGCLDGGTSKPMASAKKRDGTACEADEDCQSGHCTGSVCCSSGDCCSEATDCPRKYTIAPSCDSPESCQGERSIPVCNDSVCESMRVEDDSACDHSIIATKCGDQPDITCTGATDQARPERCAPASTASSKPASDDAASMPMSGMSGGDSEKADPDAKPAPMPMPAPMPTPTPTPMPEEMKRAAGESCTQASQCATGFCGSGICCSSGRCCKSDADCRGLPTCDTTTCLGYNNDGMCVDHSCRPAPPTPNNAICARRMAHSCGGNVDVLCGGDGVAPPECKTSCGGGHSDCKPRYACGYDQKCHIGCRSSADCGPNRVCNAITCEPACKADGGCADPDKVCNGGGFCVSATP